MATQKTVLRIFAASPSDVSDERKLLRDVINELNTTRLLEKSTLLELIDWEHVYPDIGEDAQAVINSQIPQDYDIFIGIMWNRIGTRTGRAESGTIEEFERAKARHDKNPENVHVMMYFKTVPPQDMEDFDPMQFQKVRDFRSRLEQKERALYRKFSDAEDFTRLARMNLSVLLSKHNENVHEHETNLDSIDGEYVQKQKHKNEQGLLDLQEIWEEEEEILVDIAHRLGDAIRQIGAKAQQRQKQIQPLVAHGKSNLSFDEKKNLRSEIKRVLGLTANDINGFVAQVKQELSLFREHIDRGVDAFTRTVPIHIEMHKRKNSPEVMGLKDSIIGMRDAMTGMIKSMEELYDSFDSFSRLSTNLIRSTRNARNIIREIITVAEGAINSLEQALEIIS